MEKLNLTQEWDKMFPKSDKVDHKKVTFHNRYGITLAADMYTPKGAEGKLPAIAVSGPFGEKAHSRYFSETAYSKLTGDNKELLIIPGANHTDLYDRMDGIPFEELKAFFEEYLK